MIVEFWDMVVQVVQGFVGAIIQVFSGITDLFYTATDGFTIVGQLLLIALGMSLVYFGFRFIRNLIRNRG